MLHCFRQLLEARMFEIGQFLTWNYVGTGVWTRAKFEDFAVIGALLLFSAVQNHGLTVLSSLSSTVQQSPHPPLGWGMLRSNNRRAILLSVYTSHDVGNLQQEHNFQGNFFVDLSVVLWTQCELRFHSIHVTMWFMSLLFFMFSFSSLREHARISSEARAWIGMFEFFLLYDCFTMILNRC